jgi:hypothetical protein
MSKFDKLSSAELRLELAEVEARRSRSWVAMTRKQNEINEITSELVQRGAF